jgi:hypothetical protein
LDHARTEVAPDTKSRATAVNFDARACHILLLEQLRKCVTTDARKHRPKIAERTAEARRRELFAADRCDNFAEFLFELARQLADQFTGCGRGVRIVSVCNYNVGKHLRCTSDSSANSRFFARI